MLTVDRDRILAFRVQSHHLGARLPAGRLAEAAGACGVQDTPAGSARAALHARVELTAARLDRAFADRTLVLVWSVRGAPFVVPAADLGVFTVGALPADEESFRTFLAGAGAEVDRWDRAPAAVLDQVVAAMTGALGDGVLAKGPLSTAVTAALPEVAAWCGSCRVRHLPEGLFRGPGLRGAVVLTAGADDGALTRTERWLGRPVPEVDADTARAELARRYLHCYGPATPTHFAEWTQRSRADARRAFDLLGDELVEVRAEGRRAVLLAADEAALTAPPAAAGVRLLPPGDPYVQQRDRAVLLPDRAQRSAVWRPVGGPGVVLIDGRVVGTWRARKRSTTLAVTVTPFGSLPDSDLDAEATGLARLRGCASADLTVES